jgi:hypothetical protein
MIFGALRGCRELGEATCRQPTASPPPAASGDKQTNYTKISHLGFPNLDLLIKNHSENKPLRRLCKKNEFKEIKLKTERRF